MDSSTRLRVCTRTALPRTKLETVITETPASRATSLSVARERRGSERDGAFMESFARGAGCRSACRSSCAAYWTTARDVVHVRSLTSRLRGSLYAQRELRHEYLTVDQSICVAVTAPSMVSSAPEM